VNHFKPTKGEDWFVVAIVAFVLAGLVKGVLT
jgi:hypothetical protein